MITLDCDQSHLGSAHAYVIYSQGKCHTVSLPPTVVRVLHGKIQARGSSMYLSQNKSSIRWVECIPPDDQDLVMDQR